MKNFLILMMLLQFAVAHSQRQNDTWYFSFTAGLNFSSGEPTPLSDNQIWTREGTATVSDASGNLLFYTNGEVIYNSNHEVMDNGDDLMGSFSSTQTVVVQKPGSKTIYYIFTTGSSDEPNGMAYSEVDMDLNGGLGGITLNKNVVLLATTMEGITSTYHNNGRDMWVLANGQDGFFSAFLITQDGVAATPVTSPGLGFEEDTLLGLEEVAVLKVSADGSKVAATQFSKGLFVYNFNNTSGVLGDILLSKEEKNTWFGAEFSPSGRFAYFSKDPRCSIVQYDLEATDIGSSMVEVMNVSFLTGGGLQIGPNGKIYCTHADFNKLSVIHYPDNKGVNCGVEVQGVDLGIKRVFLGLPSLFLIPVELEIISENTCLGNAIPFSFTSTLAYNSTTWDFGDGTSSTELNPIHQYTMPGTYTVTLTGHRPGMNRVVRKEVTVLPYPDSGLATSYEICAGSILTLTAPIIQGNYKWSTGSTESTIAITDGGNYSLTVVPDEGCEATYEFKVAEVECDKIPKGISPNGDGMNDSFDLTYMTVQRLSIYNRYGLEVYNAKNYVNQWSGQNNEGNELPDGTYYYFLENAKKTYTGWVYVNRQIQK